MLIRDWSSDGCSSDLPFIGPNATLIGDDLERAVRALKAEREGEIEVAGPDLAHSLTELGLIDEYRIYLHPVALGRGTPYFAGPRPRLHLMTHDRIGEDVVRSEEHTSELQSLMRISYAVFCLKKKNITNKYVFNYNLLTYRSNYTRPNNKIK